MQAKARRDVGSTGGVRPVAYRPLLSLPICLVSLSTLVDLNNVIA